MKKRAEEATAAEVRWIKETWEAEKARRRAAVKQFLICIPQNEVIPDQGYFSVNQVVALLRKYKDNPDAVQFIADMLEE